MNDFDLIEYLRKEEENFLPEPPEGLWNGIAENLPQKRRKSSIVPLWVRYCGVAACIALLFGVGMLFMDTPSDNGKLSQTTTKKLSGGSGVEAVQPQGGINDILASVKRVCAVYAAESDYVAEQRQSETDSVKTSAANGDTQRGNDTPKRDNKVKRGGSDNLWLADGNDFRTTKHQGFKGASVSLYAGNIMASNNSSQSDFMVSGTYLGETTLEGSPYGDILDLSKGSEMETRKHYKQPVRAGVRVAIPITKALSIESGVTYTLLSSSVESGSEENYYRTEQTLHYVGVPLKLRCNLWSGKRVNVYVSGGGMAEKCVSGKAKTKFFIGGTRNAVEEQKVSEKPLQLSATLSAGIEANVTKNVSLFVEPGASYYIDNHSSIDNVYKDRPFNFDLNVGVRVNINK